MIRSILAIAVGYTVMAVSVKVLNTLRSGEAGVGPGAGFLLFEILYGTLFAAAAGYLTALIAQRAEMAHAGILAAITLLLGIILILLSTEPLWYRLTDPVAEVLAILVGGYARVLRLPIRR